MSRISRLAFVVLILALLAPSAAPAQSVELAPHSSRVSAQIADQLHTAVFAKSDRQRIKAAHFKQLAIPVSIVQAAASPGALLITTPPKSFTPKPSARYVSLRAPPSRTSLIS
jgi:hypothetical protein